LVGTCGSGPVDFGRITLSALILLDVEASPAGRDALPELVAKTPVFGPRSREDRNKLSSVTVDVREILLRRQLAIRHIDEVIAAKVLPQLFVII
jgi:hypothetical protein